MKGLPTSPEDAYVFHTSLYDEPSYLDEKYQTSEPFARIDHKQRLTGFASKWLSIIKWLILCTLLIFFIRSRSVPDSSPAVEAAAAPDLCLEPECVHAASEILYNLDSNYKNLDPCVDFDQYVCKGWRDRHDMRPDQGEIFTGTLMAENAQMRLRHILEAATAPGAQILTSGDKESFDKLKSAYDSCMNVDALKARGSQPLEDIFARIDSVYNSGGKNSEKNLTDAFVYLMQIDVSALLDLSISPDDRDPDNVVIMVNPPRVIGLPSREYYNDTGVVDEYETVVSRLFGSFHSTSLSPLAPQLAKNVVLFEKRLADATPDVQSLNDVTQYYNPRTVAETGTLLPEISFDKIISEMAPKDVRPDRLIIASPSYLSKLSKIIKDSPRDVILAFFKLKAMQAYYNDVEDSKLQPLREINNRLAGKDPRAVPERWRKCIRDLDSGLGWILSRFFILDAFPEESKQLGDQIVSDIKEQFIYVLDKTKWMSGEVRQLGKQKVANIVQKIGYPTKSPNLLSEDDVNEYYRNLNISKDAFFENRIEMARFALDEMWSQLGKPTNRDLWGMTASTVNAYYNPPGNEIVFPAGIIQPPIFYGPKAPLYLAYGALGSVAGHELSHAFDSSGRHYDQTGNYTNWWDKETIDAFEERTQCFVDQYSNFTIPGPKPDSEPLHVNGKLTLGENIADAGGLSASFQAWKKRESSHADQALPGLEYFTKEQLFFITYANFWCTKTTKEAAIQAIYTDPHSPNFARILGTLANSGEFQAAFKCKNKEPVCKLW